MSKGFFQDSEIKRIFEVVIETTQKCKCNKNPSYYQDCSLKLQLEDKEHSYDLKILLKERLKTTKTKFGECKKTFEVTNRISRLPPVLNVTLNRTVANEKLQNQVRFLVNGLNMKC